MRRIRVVAVTVVALAALSACGSSGSSGENTKDSGSQVASLVTSEAKPSTTAGKTSKADPPRERLDTTPEEFEALLVPFNKCLKKAGFKDSSDAKKTAADQAQDQVRPATKKDEKRLAAYRVCEEQYYPLPPWEKDPANPEARDFAVAVVKCLKKKGVKYVEVSEDGLSPSFGGKQNDARSISMGLDLAPECEREVAASK
jgi:hypothetical protein